MKIEHLEERVNDYKNSIKTVVEKKICWQTQTKNLLITTLNTIAKKYNIGWRVQELNWINTNEAINITLESFPDDLIESTNKIPSYQFIKGGSLVFSQSHNGDVNVFILFPLIENVIDNANETEIETYAPETINEKLIIEKVDEFLKEMINWEVPSLKNKVGF